MSTRILQILLPALLALFAAAAFVTVDFLGVRSRAEVDKPNFTQYVAGFVRKERAAESKTIETVAAIGEVPGDTGGSDGAPPDQLAEAATLAEDVVSRDAVPPPSSWFRRDQADVQVKVEFICVKGVGGSKVCTAETLKR